MIQDPGYDIRPLVIEKVYGLRAFRPSDDGVLLPVGIVGKASGFTWQPGENEAVCSFHKIAPTKGCKCGLYGMTDGTNDYFSIGYTIQGIIEASGRLVVGTKGFKAQKAKIVALVQPYIDLNGAGEKVVYRFNKCMRKFPQFDVFPTLRSALDEFPISKLDINTLKGDYE